MVNIALILVGQLRTYQKAFPRFHENFIKPLMCWAHMDIGDRFDIYLALDRKNNIRSLMGSQACSNINDADLSFFKPYCHHHYFQIFETLPRTYHECVDRTSQIDRKYYKIFDFAIQWAYLKEGWKHLCAIEKKHNIEYQIIIKSRPDFTINIPFNCDKLDLQTYIYTFMDQFLLGRRTYMSHVCDHGIDNFNKYYTNPECFDNDQTLMLRWNCTSEIQSTCLVREICNEFSLREHDNHHNFALVRTDGEIVNGPMTCKLYRIRPEETHQFHLKNVHKYEYLSLSVNKITRITYGALHSHSIDVTAHLCEYLRKHDEITVTNQLMGSDPCRGIQKILSIYADGQLYILHENNAYKVTKLS